MKGGPSLERAERRNWKWNEACERCNCTMRALYIPSRNPRCCFRAQAIPGGRVFVLNNSSTSPEPLWGSGSETVYCWPLELSPQTKTSCDPQSSSTSPHFLPRTTSSAIMNILTCSILSALALGCHAQAGTRTEAKITLVESDTLYHTLCLEYLAEFSKNAPSSQTPIFTSPAICLPDNPRNSCSLQLFFSSRRRPFEKPNQHSQRRLCAPGRLLFHRIWQLAGQPSERARRQRLHPVRHSLGRLRQTSNSNPRPLARPRWRQRPMDATPARPRLRHLLLPPQTPASR